MLDRRVALADSFALSIESRKSDVRAQLESEVFMNAQESIIAIQGPPEWLTLYKEYSGSTPTLESVAEVYVLRLDAFLNMLEFTNLYFRYEQGLYPEENWVLVRQAIKSQLSLPMNRAVFLTTGGSFRPLAEELVAEIDRENGT